MQCCERDRDEDGNCDRHPLGLPKLRPLHDYMLVQLEPVKEFTRGIIRVAPEPVRLARVVRVGPGRHYIDGKFVPTTVEPGDRIAFLQAVTETQQGKQLHWIMPDNHELIRETDVLFVIPPGTEVEVTQ
jgi:co-chaperonin GroES (HSP10)